MRSRSASISARKNGVHARPKTREVKKASERKVFGLAKAIEKGLKHFAHLAVKLFINGIMTDNQGQEKKPSPNPFSFKSNSEHQADSQKINQNNAAFCERGRIFLEQDRRHPKRY